MIEELRRAAWRSQGAREAHYVTEETVSAIRPLDGALQ
jgi:hypothetical protein